MLNVTNPPPKKNPYLVRHIMLAWLCLFNCYRYFGSIPSTSVLFIIRSIWKSASNYLRFLTCFLIFWFWGLAVPTEYALERLTYLVESHSDGHPAFTYEPFFFLRVVWIIWTPSTWFFHFLFTYLMFVLFFFATVFCITLVIRRF